MASFIYNGWDTASTAWANSGTYSSTIVTYSTTANNPEPEPTKPGPLAWLDERVDEIEEMGREMLEAA